MIKTVKQSDPTTSAHHKNTCFCFACFTARFQPACSTAAISTRPSASGGTFSAPSFIYLLGTRMRPELQHITLGDDALQRAPIHHSNSRLPSVKERIGLTGGSVVLQNAKGWPLDL